MSAQPHFMKSYKCPKCGLVCWLTATICKRCQTPNPHLTQSSADIEIIQSGFANEEINSSITANNRSVSQNYQESAKSIAVAPPNYWDSDKTGKFVKDVFNAVGIAFRSIFPREDNLTQLEAAEKNIRWAWKAGRIGVSLTIGIVFEYFFLNIKYSIASAILPFILIIPYLGINIGLVYGIYRKSRFCATILFCCAIVTVLISLVNLALTKELQHFISLVFSILFCYFYLLGFLGTFKNFRLIKP